MGEAGGRHRKDQASGMAATRQGNLPQKGRAYNHPHGCHGAEQKGIFVGNNQQRKLQQGVGGGRGRRRRETQRNSFQDKSELGVSIFARNTGRKELSSNTINETFGFFFF